MSKRMIYTCLSIVCMVFVSVGCGAQYVPVDRLPKHASEFLSTFYPGETVISVENEGWMDGYDVILKNGTHIDFSRKGKLESIEAAKGQKLPDGLFEILPAPLTTYLKTNYPGKALTQITQDNKRWEIEVEGIRHELIFDARGNYLGADD